MRIVPSRDLIRRYGDCGLADSQHADPFKALVHAIISQQLSTRAAATIAARFRLHRPHVLPVGDLGIVKAVQKAYRLRKVPTADRLIRLGESWRPYRSVACWYLWANLEHVLVQEFRHLSRVLSQVQIRCSDRPKIWQDPTTLAG